MASRSSSVPAARRRQMSPVARGAPKAGSKAKARPKARSRPSSSGGLREPSGSGNSTVQSAGRAVVASRLTSSALAALADASGSERPECAQSTASADSVCPMMLEMLKDPAMAREVEGKARSVMAMLGEDSSAIDRRCGEISALLASVGGGAEVLTDDKLEAEMLAINGSIRRAGDAVLAPETRDAQDWHGLLAEPDWDTPKCVAKSEEEARPGYLSMDACEYVDTKETLKKKVKLLAALMRNSNATVIYSGAGLSTSAGIGDYASKAKGSAAPHKQARSSVGSRLDLQPTYGYHALAALEDKGLIHHWLQQNHDRLPQKAGVPQQKTNEIHGAWGDDKNMILMMDDPLRKDLRDWMIQWGDRAELCLAMGTSLCGMTADGVAQRCADRYSGGAGQGLVIMNLQQTSMDRMSSLRIWGTLDDILKLLAKELHITVPSKKVAERGERWQSDHPRCSYATPIRKASDPL